MCLAGCLTFLPSSFCCFYYAAKKVELTQNVIITITITCKSTLSVFYLCKNTGVQVTWRVKGQIPNLYVFDIQVLAERLLTILHSILGFFHTDSRVRNGKDIIFLEKEVELLFKL